MRANFVKDPREQFVQTELPSNAANCPGGQGSHSVIPSSSA